MDSCYTVDPMFAHARQRLGALVLPFALAQAGCGGDRCEECDAGSSRASSPARAAERDAGERDAERVRAPEIVQVDDACVVQSVRAKRGIRPVDAIFIVDNSGSMNEEIAAIRASINDNFAAIIDASGVDLRVIMISRFGAEGTHVCVEPPLGGAACSEGVAATNSVRFFHYDLEIGSNDALCQLLASFDFPDDAGRAPDGWRGWLRPASAKAFVVATDDSVRCAYREQGREVAFGAETSPEEDALLFHRTLLSKAPEQFGAAPDTRYQFFSIVGMLGTGTAGSALLPHQPVDEKVCDTAMTAGQSYQALSIATDALRYPVCEGRSFDQVFKVLARSVVEASSADCMFDLPKQSAGGDGIDLSTVNLAFRAAEGGAERQFAQVESRAACADATSFYIDPRAGRIELCPSACTLVKRDEAPEIAIRYGCEVFVQ